MKPNRFVFDTNTIISASLLLGSVSNRALLHAFEIGTIMVSHTTFAELTEVLFRKKFDKYLSIERKIQIIQKLEHDTRLCEVNVTITDCRDPKDNKFLELAVESGASCIITGDKDLLVLHPYKNIPILSPADFLDKF
jgi:uncharacterized protein